MAAQPPQKPIHTIILDTGPLIKNAVSISTIINSAEELYTTPAIISEIRDEATRSRVQTTLVPFLKIRDPSPSSYDAVIAFSKKTGDYSVLSRQDLGILALAYEVHCERNEGPFGLRSAPGQPITRKEGEVQNAQERSKKTEMTAQGGSGDSPDITQEAKVASDVEAQAKESETTGPKDEPRAGLEVESEALTMEQEDLGSTPNQEADLEIAESEAQTSESAEPSAPAEGPVETKNTTESLEQSLASLEIASPTPNTEYPSPPLTDDSDSDGGEWITPSNLSKHKAKDTGTQLSTREAPEPQMDVATMTIDFAMQNVLLQMNLKLLSTNMQRIKRIQSKVLRCHACFLITHDMTKQFCPRCGQPTLNRVSCSTNAKGEFRVHLAKNYQYNKRGDRYSVPKPINGTPNGKWVGKGGGQGGWGRDLILTEDQKEFQRQVGEQKRNKTRDLMDEDYLPNILSGERGRAGGRPRVGAGKNVNSKKRF